MEAVDEEQKKRIDRIEKRKQRLIDAQNAKAQAEEQEKQRLMKLRLGLQDSKMSLYGNIRPLSKNASQKIYIGSPKFLLSRNKESNADL